MVLLYIAAGGVLGTLARYGLSGRILMMTGQSFPWGTFWVNVIGSLLLGFGLRVAELTGAGAEIRGLLAIGFCGAFTTFSTLTYETIMLLQSGSWTRAGLYAFGSLALGLLAIVVGFSLATLTLRVGG
ncbi:MAG: fluoride efflux transporter CrcB [Longimicrobiales bacterium]